MLTTLVSSHEDKTSQPKSPTPIAKQYHPKMTQTYRLLRLPDVKDITGLSKSSIYARIAEGTFPKQILLGPRLVAWAESDIQKWVHKQVNTARG